MARRRIIRGSEFKLLPLPQHYFYVESYLLALLKGMDYFIVEYNSKTACFGLSLTFADDHLLGPVSDNKVMSDFHDSVKAYFASIRCSFFGIWVKEYSLTSTVEGKLHYHYLAMISGQQYQSLWQHIDELRMLWDKAMISNWRFEGGFSVSDKMNGVMVDHRDANGFRYCFRKASYLAKAYSKGNFSRGIGGNRVPKDYQLSMMWKEGRNNKEPINDGVILK